MNAREAVIATLKREPVDFIPGWLFFSTGQAQKVIMGKDFFAENAKAKNEIEFAKATGSSIVNVHGNLRMKRIIEQTDTQVTIELENGTTRLCVFEPEAFYETLWRPLDDTDNVKDMKLPDVNSYPEYWAEVKHDTEKCINEGFFVRGSVDGFYAGIWEHCCKIDKFLMSLAEGSDFAQELVDTWGQFMYNCAEKLLECGVDCIWWTDDLGSNTGPLISSKCYRKYFLPWHTKTAELTHKYGKLAMMHSHGNINLLIDDMLESGIDLLDPVGPSDGMVLKDLKDKYGSKVAFSGGISKFIAQMTIGELEEHLDEVYRVGSKGGGFLPCEEGGVPKDMTREKFEIYMKLRNEMSKKYAN